MSGRDRALLSGADPKDNEIRGVANRRNSGRDEPRRLTAQAYLSNASEYFSAVPKGGLADLQQKLSLSDRMSVGASHG